MKRWLSVLLAFYRHAMQDFKPAEACEKPVNPRSMF